MNWEPLIWIYLIAIFGVGIFAGRFVKDFSDFTFGGGRLGKLMMSGTVIGTQWGGVTFLGIAGFAYTGFYQGAWYALGPSARFLLWAFLLAVVIRKVQPFTISEWFALRFGSKSGVLATVLNSIAGIGLLGAQFVAFGSIASTFMGWDLTTGILIGAVVVIAYTAVGGFFGDVAIDTIQMFFTVAGALTVLIAAVVKYGSMGTIREDLPADYFDPFEPFGLFFMLTIFMLWCADLPLQYTLQRISGARTVKVAFTAAVLGGISYLLVFYASPAIGAYARVALPDLASPDQAYPALTQAILPAGWAAFIAAVLLAEIMNTADSYILGPASLLTNDLYRVWRPHASSKQVLWVSRVFTLMFGLVGLYSALQFQAIIDLILTFLVIGWAMLPAYFASTMWRRASANAAFASMLVGAAINGYLITRPPALFDGYEPYYTGWVGFSAALVILVVGSLLSPDRGWLPDEGDQRALAGLPPQ